MRADRKHFLLKNSSYFNNFSIFITRYPQVPDRIMVAGGDAPVQAKATPRELQLDAAVLPPTLEHVRVSTPPRSIKLGELAFPSATDDEGSMASSTRSVCYALSRMETKSNSVLNPND